MVLVDVLLAVGWTEATDVRFSDGESEPVETQVPAFSRVAPRPLGLFLLPSRENELDRLIEILRQVDRSFNHAHGPVLSFLCEAWLVDNYATPNPVSVMTQRSGLSERSFKRRFSAATAYTPVEYVKALRIEEAKQMLETENAAIEEFSCRHAREAACHRRQIAARKRSSHICFTFT